MPGRKKAAKKAGPGAGKQRSAGAGAAAARAGKSRGGEPVKLLSGGNPQIAKGDGDAPVRAYIDALARGGPAWKAEVARGLDGLIVRTVPGVRKAVRWNSPIYGVAGRGWVVSFHVFARYVKVTFFNGRALDPMPPGGTAKSGEARWIDLFEGDWGRAETRERVASWVKQAAALPGWVVGEW